MDNRDSAPDLSIRAFQEHDRQAVRAIWESTFRQAHALPGEELTLGQQYQVVDIYMASVEIYVAGAHGTCSEDIQGFIGLLSNSYVSGLFVAPSAQRQGIGRALLAHVQQFSNTLTVEVYAENTGALNFYKRCGFVEEKRKSLHEKEWPRTNYCAFAFDSIKLNHHLPCIPFIFLNLAGACFYGQVLRLLTPPTKNG